LAKLRWLFVIARNSSFTFRGKAVDIRRVAENSVCVMYSKVVFAEQAIAFA
jgi:TolB-like protein